MGAASGDGERSQIGLSASQKSRGGSLGGMELQPHNRAILIKLQILINRKLTCDF
jgi:hypothetical protein